MTREEHIDELKRYLKGISKCMVPASSLYWKWHYEEIIKALEQEPRKDEVILTNKEYRELISNEYDHGYCKGYAEALQEQEPIIDKIYADIQKLRGCSCSCSDGIIDDVEEILDKYKAETEDT